MKKIRDLGKMSLKSIRKNSAKYREFYYSLVLGMLGGIAIGVIMSGSKIGYLLLILFYFLGLGLIIISISLLEL